MEKSMHLAIASVPVQTWKDMYEEDQAFSKGTVFPELDMPFFVTDEQENKACECGCRDKGGDEEDLRTIQKTAFVLDDLRLYLDTHPEDIKALQCFKSALKRKKALAKEFALKHYPLTVDCMADIYDENPDSSCYCWQEGPIPWEGGLC